MTGCGGPPGEGGGEEGGCLPYLEPVVPHSQVENIIPLLLFAPVGQQLWGGWRQEGETRSSPLLAPVSQRPPPLSESLYDPGTKSPC